MNEDPKQPLYIAPEERVTLDQLKHRAEEISNLAVSESKRVAHDVYEENLSKAVLVAVGVVVVAASLAYFFGIARGRAAAAAPPQPPCCYVAAADSWRPCGSSASRSAPSGSRRSCA